MKIELGLPLKPTELDTYYVDANTEQMEQFSVWLKGDEKSPILISGQIGSGKSTFLEQGYKLNNLEPTIRLKFDTEVVDYTRGGFMSYLFVKLALFYKERFDPTVNQLNKAESILEAIEDFNLDILSTTIQKGWDPNSSGITNLFDQQFDLHARQIKQMLSTFSDQDIFIVAEGIDKFELTSTAFISLEPVLNCLTNSNTIFETNITHYLKPSTPNNWNDCDKLLIGIVQPEAIKECLEKRLELTAKQYKFILPALTALSGGNFRQAVRLLKEYQGQKEESINKRLDKVVKRTRNSLLDLPSLKKWGELFKVIDRDKTINGGTARDNAKAIYGNLLLIESDEDGNFPCRVNPLIEPLTKVLKEDLPEDKESETLKKWASDHDMSDIGLSGSTGGYIHQIIEEYTQPELNIHDVFQKLGDQFFGREQGITIIAYRDIKMAKIANQYLQGHAATYRLMHFNPMRKNRITDFNHILKNKTNYDVYSYFIENYTDKFLSNLDSLRDSLLDKSMVWWIQKEKLFQCLQNWPHLRQFLKVYILEEEILSWLKIQEIENDIELLEEVGYEDAEQKAYVEQLTQVLNSLKEQNH